MKHWFLDTNVLVDFLINRQPFALEAAALFELGRQQRVVLYAASLSFATVYYLVRQGRSHEQALALVAQLERLVQVVAVDGPTVRAALSGEFRDFEDGLQYFSARSMPLVEAIVTRNAKDFRTGSLPTYLPAEAVGILLA
ncbi:type II toxin-antitoxin system VapC family toxin [Hymenobacter ruricola]|uniref:PIN domain-containing protein n=1 Tax=Hymenobacter ruricola TaxID=2791023 RepID=A0ABS0I566_9BACT|nr:PIN domain-containing protein [Hymenobacter ruricola]MBF9222091.1 PIN domain-containing protein [Hymenobacter ruricola]